MQLCSREAAPHLMHGCDGRVICTTSGLPSNFCSPLSITTMAAATVPVPPLSNDPDKEEQPISIAVPPSTPAAWKEGSALRQSSEGTPPSADSTPREEAALIKAMGAVPVQLGHGHFCGRRAHILLFSVAGLLVLAVIAWVIVKSLKPSTVSSLSLTHSTCYLSTLTGLVNSTLHASNVSCVFHAEVAGSFSASGPTPPFSADCEPWGDFLLTALQCSSMLGQTLHCTFDWQPASNTPIHPTLWLT